MLEHRIPSLRQFSKAGVAALAQCHRERPVDTGTAQSVQRRGHQHWVARVVIAEFYGGVRASFANPMNAGGRVAMENRSILGNGDRARRFDDRIGIRIFGSAVDCLEFAALDFEGHAQFDQRHYLAQPSLDLAWYWWVDLAVAAGGDGGCLPALRPDEIDQLARCKRRLQRPSRFLLDLFPTRLGNRRQFTV